ncbi:MAG: hypothetical protein ACT4R6_07755 [Gemmatimonadaceae bacterium]
MTWRPAMAANAMRSTRTYDAPEENWVGWLPPSVEADVVQAMTASVAMSAGRLRSVPRQARQAAADAGDDYQLSEAPAPVHANVVVAQSAGAQPARALQVVEIATTIAGATMTRILDNEGDVHWELDQLNGALHPDGATSTPGSATYQTKTINVTGFSVQNKAGQRTFADFEITFQYNGASLGYIQVAPTHTGDAWGEGLRVKEQIMPDANTYTVPGGSARFAAIKVRFQYRFEHYLEQDALALQELTLFGNGDFSHAARWTQAP